MWACLGPTLPFDELDHQLGSRPTVMIIVNIAIDADNAINIFILLLQNHLNSTIWYGIYDLFLRNYKIRRRQNECLRLLTTLHTQKIIYSANRIEFVAKFWRKKPSTPFQMQTDYALGSPPSSPPSSPRLPPPSTLPSPKRTGLRILTRFLWWAFRTWIRNHLGGELNHLMQFISNIRIFDSVNRAVPQNC